MGQPELRSFVVREARPFQQLWLFRLQAEALAQVEASFQERLMQGKPFFIGKWSELYLAGKGGTSPLLVKRLRVQKEAHYVRRYFLCQGKREFFSSMRLSEIGINCPEPLGYAVNLIPWSRADSIFVSRFIPEAVTSTHWVREGGARREEVMRAVAADLRRMLEHNLFYRDLHTNNLLVKEGPGGEGLSLYWIDNDLRPFHPSQRRRKRELLVERWLEVAGLTPDEKVRFESELERGN